jgi:hypothetical protein
LTRWRSAVRARWGLPSQTIHAAQVNQTGRRFRFLHRPSKCSRKCSLGPGWVQTLIEVQCYSGNTDVRACSHSSEQVETEADQSCYSLPHSMRAGEAATTSAMIGVAVANIALNVLVRKASTRAWPQLMTSAPFLAALTVGIGSLLLLTFVYRHEANIGRAMLLMGTLAILIGNALGYARGERLSTAETSLLLLVAVFVLVAIWNRG